MLECVPKVPRYFINLTKRTHRGLSKLGTECRRIPPDVIPRDSNCMLVRAFILFYFLLYFLGKGPSAWDDGQKRKREGIGTYLGRYLWQFDNVGLVASLSVRMMNAKVHSLSHTLSLSSFFSPQFVLYIYIY